MDISETIEPKSDQLNFEDFVDGRSKTFTITEVSKGSAEQPVTIKLAESDRPFKPSKTVRRILVAAWGREAANYTGHRMTLFGDPTVKWAGQAVGGIRVSHLSHIDKRLTLALSESKGKRKTYVIEPLSDAPTPATVLPETLAELEALFTEAGIPDDQRLPGANRITGGTAVSIKALSEPQAQQVIAALRRKIGR